MKETRQIIAAYEQAESEGRKTALATVVRVEGSSYRAPGARMLVADDGSVTGAISGGCLESDALRKALMVIMQDTPLLVSYRTTDEDDRRGGISLGCNGVIDVLIEPVHPEDAHNPVALLRKAAGERAPVVLVTLFSPADRRHAGQGSRLLAGMDASFGPAFLSVRADVTETALGAMLSGELKQVFDSGRSRLATLAKVAAGAFNSGSMMAFLQYIPTEISLVVAGAGADVLPVVQMATLMGWETTLIDDRPRDAGSSGFARCQLIVAAPEDAVLEPVLHARSACLLMSHNYHYDKAMMRRLAAYQVPYIGMLGPRKKKERMLQELEKEGVRFTAAQLGCVHSPVGLDIGAETPEEIACAIIAEISTVFSGRTGQPLDGFPASVHDRTMTGQPEALKENKP
jgi:xanthine/CO dehydrogenase XdhC/CoxF family maturation factor